MSDMTPAPQQEGRSRRRSGEGSWMVGLILILLGVAFFLERSGVISMVGNWWAIFIYLAAFASFANAWRAYRGTNAFGQAAGASLTWGLVLTVVASIFMFNLLWDTWWPMILIAVGVGIVASSYLGRGSRKTE
jgi:hypothetical protein